MVGSRVRATVFVALRYATFTAGVLSGTAPPGQVIPFVYDAKSFQSCFASQAACESANNRCGIAINSVGLCVTSDAICGHPTDGRIGFDWYCPDGSGFAPIPTLGLPQTPFEAAAVSAFLCFQSLQNCSHSPLNSCGPAAAGQLGSGVGCLPGTLGGKTYSPCLLAPDPSPFGFYCPDGSDGTLEIDPVSADMCFASQLTCQLSKLNSCGSSTPCLNHSGSTCLYADSAFPFACPLSAVLNGASSTDDAVSNMVCFATQDVCHSSLINRCGNTTTAQRCKKDTETMNICAHTVHRKAGLSWYCPDGTGSSAVMSLNLPAASYQVDPYSGFHCYISAAACQNSPLNTCGSFRTNEKRSGVACQRTYISASGSVYSPCTYTDSKYNTYCPDGSDQPMEVDTVTGSQCYTSLVRCNNSPLNECKAPSAVSNVSKAVSCVNTNTTTCMSSDRPYTYSCPLSAAAAGTSSTDDTISSMKCYVDAYACQSSPTNTCNGSGDGSHSCVLAGPEREMCSHPATLIAGMSWYCPDGSGSVASVKLNLPAASFEYDRFSGFHCYTSVDSCLASPLNTCGQKQRGSLLSGVTCVRNVTGPSGKTLIACENVDKDYTAYCPDGSDQFVQVDAVTGIQCFTSQLSCESSPMNPCGLTAQGAVQCNNDNLSSCANSNALYVYSCPISVVSSATRNTAAVLPPLLLAPFAAVLMSPLRLPCL